MYIKGPLKETNLTFNALTAHKGYTATKQVESRYKLRML